MSSSQIGVNELLAQMRALAAQTGIRSSGDTPAAGAGEFSALLRQSIDQVNATQQEAARLGAALEVGDPSVNLADVMIASQKASVSFQAMTQVRNKLVAAYQEIMSMQI